MPATKKTVVAKKPAAKEVKTSTPIEAYSNPPPRAIDSYHQLPFEFPEGDGMVHEALDDITTAVEAGKLTKEGWVLEIFKAPEDFERFLEALGEYDENCRITDQWWLALSNVADYMDEAEFSRTEDIAAVLRDTAVRTGQL